MSEIDPARLQQTSSLRDSHGWPTQAQRHSPSPPPANINRDTWGKRTDFPSQGEINPRTRLLESYESYEPACGSRQCNHGTFSPRPGSFASQQTSSGPVQSNRVGEFGDSSCEGSSIQTNKRDDFVPAPSRLPSRVTTKQLAKKYGVNRRMMCVLYTFSPSASYVYLELFANYIHLF